MTVSPNIRDDLDAFIHGMGRLAKTPGGTTEDMIAANRELLVLLARAILQLDAAVEQAQRRVDRPEGTSG